VHSDKERARARQLSAESVAAGDATGWFERLYAEAEAGVSVVPWADGLPDPQLVEWADGLDGGRLWSAAGLATTRSSWPAGGSR
jgi:hypothetical protein